MPWLKDVVLDLLVTVVLALAVFLDQTWARWFIWVYTPLMLALKVSAFLAGSSRKLKVRASGAPGWFYHVVYAANLVIALLGRWWPIAAGWALIWLLSAIDERRLTGRAKKQ